ncbi:MAG TPA: LacI family DNA-binding transcriptional regulator [Rectinemataceae bacterium]|nr:LacI family DNA-binding transcriptional regulator [Rectinemataceae bacterium]
MKITIKDIAERAGVSKTTVSFALNNPKRISKETYEKIMAIVGELGYFPSPVARTLTTKRLGALGLLLPQPISEVMNNPHLCDVISGIGEECDKREISLIMLPPVRGKIIEAARRAFVDAIVTIGVGPEHEVIDFLSARRVPFVTIDSEETGTTTNVGIEHERAAYDLMSYILSLDPARIAVLCLKPDAKNHTERSRSVVLEKRLAGFARALQEMGLSIGSDRARLIEAEGSIEGGRVAGRILLDAPDRPDAIVAMADIVALGIYSAAAELGIHIPDQLSIAGFDDITFSRYARPPLTTVHQPAREKGQKAASLALDILNGGKPAHFTFPYTLEIRGSTKPTR